MHWLYPWLYPNGNVLHNLIPPPLYVETYIVLYRETYVVHWQEYVRIALLQVGEGSDGPHYGTEVGASAPGSKPAEAKDSLIASSLPAKKASKRRRARRAERHGHPSRSPVPDSSPLALSITLNPNP